MKQGHFEEHWLDSNGNPAGGVSTGTGFTVSWQNGPLGRGEQLRRPNGAFVEDLIAVVIGRIEFYQRSKFACQENDNALANLRRAAYELDQRTTSREVRAVEGTHAA